MSWSRQWVKLCDVADFADPVLCRLAAEIEGRDGRDSPPQALVERKQWERAMLAGVLTESGRLGPNCSVLAIGAGSEPVLFWLANRAGRVVATDIYGEGKFSGLEAAESMLHNPSAFAPVAYPHERLLVRRMDARTLDFAEATFDVVYSLSSIEHFGAAAEIARSAAEMGRVLAPGGLAVVVTECLVRRHPLDSAAAETAIRLATFGRRRAGAHPRQRVALGEAFTLHELVERVVAPSGLRLAQRVDRTISPASWENVTTVHAGGRLEPASGSVHPHVLLRVSRSVFTSICLVLEKPAGSPS
ncbi:MAG TPA: class I SAM-dependent methyltransferase [Actinomycetota bacterium]|nr:class I SAM-dependent methyltransferase [Actinomycetota bacterium]